MHFLSQPHFLTYFDLEKPEKHSHNFTKLVFQLKKTLNWLKQQKSNKKNSRNPNILFQVIWQPKNILIALLLSSLILAMLVN
jgi:hypothetical protein